MGFRVSCTCGKQFGVKDQYLGKKGKCPYCNASLLLKPTDGSASAPATSATDAPPAKKTASAGKTDRPDKDSKPAEARKKPRPGEKVEVREADEGDIELRSGGGAIKVSAETGTVDLSSQVAGIRHIIQRFCPTCGTRYNEGAARCSNCHAPLSAEEIAAAKAAKKPPLIPWLPNMHLSTKAKIGVGAGLVVLLMVVVYFVFLFGPLRNRSRLQAEFFLVEQALTKDTLVNLTLDMPGYPWKRPASVKAIGKWGRRVGPAVFDIVGTGTYELDKRELVLTGVDGGKPATYQVVAPPALQTAAAMGDLNRLKTLLKAPGCNVNQTDDQGVTALHAAARTDQVEAIKLLLKHGADTKLKDKKGYDPVSAALATSNKKAAKILRAADANDPAKIVLLPD